MRRAAPRLVVLLPFLLLVQACGDDDAGGTGADAGVDAGVDAGADAASIESVAISETKTLAGLGAAVEVVRDTRGAPHIYARTITDAVRVQAYLMARDRFGQMEFLRRLSLGRLAELSPMADLIAMDRDARFRGYRRQGIAIYNSLASDAPSKQIADAFTAGMNVYIDEILAASDKSEFIPPGAETVFAVLFGSPFFGHWEPADIFAMARFQSANLAYAADREVNRTRALAGVREKLDAAHQGAFVDLFPERQARQVYTRPGFPAQKPGRARKPAPMQTPGTAVLDAAIRYLEMQRGLSPYYGSTGSNNWVITGSKTASGAPILANDPHLALVSPGVWWYVHLNTKKYGGPTGVNVDGVAFASLPGVVLGFNEDLAWGATVTGFDVTDVYEETVTEGATPTVLYKGNQVAIETIDEVIKMNGAPDEIYKIENVPHHGPIIPGTHMNGKALSIRYTGYEISDELAFFTQLASARTIDEAFAAQRNFKVGSQNIVTVSRDGHIAWNTDSRVPVRDPRAVDMTIDARGIVSGHCPTFVLPGTGEYEWTGDLPFDLIPHDRDPAKGWIATANQDSVGVTDDNNPCNQTDHYYLGGAFADGFREGRIQERLTTLTSRGGITKDDMIALQAENQSQMADSMRDPIVAILGRVTAAGNGTFTEDEKAQLTDVKNRLVAWSKLTPHGVGATDPAVIADSVATTIFAVGVTRVVPLAIGDEVAAIGAQPSSPQAAIFLDRALAHPDTLATYDGTSDTILWDDIGTGRVETKDEIVGRGFLNALAFLKDRLGADMSTWRWGRLHNVRFNSVLPFAGGLSIPTTADPEFADGFPRHGDFGAVDVGDFSLFAPQSFTLTTNGPSQRLVVEMLPTGPKAYNALPGGQSIRTDSPHHDDEARLYWTQNKQPPVNFLEADVVKNAEARIRFVP